MKNKRYIIIKGKARISFSDIEKTAKMNGFNYYRFSRLIFGAEDRYKGWSLEYAKKTKN